MYLNFKIFLFSISICLLATLFTSCDSKRVFEENKEIPDGIWAKNYKAGFSVDIKDTINPHNIFVNIRNAGEYPYRNIYLFITTNSKGIVAKDTFECILADEKGKWMGSGLGDIWDNQIAYKKNVRFPHAGKYNFEIEQAMRTDNLPFVIDVGLRIERKK